MRTSSVIVRTSAGPGCAFLGLLGAMAGGVTCSRHATTRQACSSLPRVFLAKQPMQPLLSQWCSYVSLPPGASLRASPRTLRGTLWKDRRARTARQAGRSRSQRQPAAVTESFPRSSDRPEAGGQRRFPEPPQQVDKRATGPSWPLPAGDSRPPSPSPGHSPPGLTQGPDPRPTASHLALPASGPGFAGDAGLRASGSRGRQPAGTVVLSVSPLRQAASQRPRRWGGAGPEWGSRWAQPLGAALPAAQPPGTQPPSLVPVGGPAEAGDASLGSTRLSSGTGLGHSPRHSRARVSVGAVPPVPRCGLSGPVRLSPGWLPQPRAQGSLGTPTPPGTPSVGPPLPLGAVGASRRGTWVGAIGRADCPRRQPSSRCATISRIPGKSCVALGRSLRL